MARYRNNLPQLAGGLFLTDGGIGNKKGVGSLFLTEWV